ncbi:hypothetical protein Tco_0011356 [Tanacetum coccineum]
MKIRIIHTNLHESDREFIFNEWIPDSYDVEEEYAREIGDLYSRRFEEYNMVFNNEIEHLTNEYILRIKKGYVLDDVWEKCQQNYKKTNEAWHDEAYEEDEIWQIRDEKSDYDPPYVNVKTFEVKKYSFKGGRSFICITDREDEALPLGRMNGERFKAMIRKELEVNMEDDVDISALTMEQYIALSPDDIKPGIVNPKIGDDVEFKINAKLIRELRCKLFAGTDNEDAYEHVYTVLEIVDLFHFLGVTHDVIMLRVFPITLKGRALK